MATKKFTNGHVKYQDNPFFVIIEEVVYNGKETESYSYDEETNRLEILPNTENGLPHKLTIQLF